MPPAASIPRGAETGADSLRRAGVGDFASRAGWTACWLATLAMIGAAGCWVASFAPWPFLQWINAFTAYFYLPAYAILILAIGVRRQRLVLAASLLVGWHLSIVVPSLSPLGGSNPAIGPTQSELRVFYANVGKESRQQDALFDEIREAEPDVLVLTEFTEAWHNEFHASELPANFPHATHLEKYTPAATVIYSRLPITEDELVYESRRIVVKARLEAGDSEVCVYAIHAPRPLRSPLHRYDEYWDLVLSDLGDEVGNGPLLLIGDFNATPYSLIIRKVRQQLGLRDCHAVAGRGWVTTWPNGTRALPPIRIDHALISPGLDCAAITEGHGVGSDHRPLIVDLAVEASP